MNLTRVQVLLKMYYRVREEQGIEIVHQGGSTMIEVEFKFWVRRKRKTLRE